MKYITYIFLTMAVLCTAIVHSQSKEELLLLHKTYGFIEGQQYLLNYISVNYPDKVNKVKIAQVKFYTSYGKALQNINKDLKLFYGKDYNSFISSFNESLQEEFSKRKKLKQENINNFIGLVERRAKGYIESPILEMINAYQYKDNPVKELRLKYKKHYQIIDNSNPIKNTITITLPNSWKEVDSKSKDVLKKFRSLQGFGNEIITITLIDRKEILSDIQQPNQDKILLSSDNIQIGERYYTVSKYEVLDKSTKIHLTKYSTLYNHKVLSVNCYIYQNHKENFDKSIEKFNPLFESIAKSTLLNNNNNEKKLITYKQ